MGRSFANLHIKSNNLEKTVEALRELSEGHASVLGKSNDGTPESKAVMYVSKSNETWISVLHDYFVWGTVKKAGRTLSGLIGEPVMTASYMNEEIFELSLFENGELQAERIFCEQWTRDEYEQLREERINDDYLQRALDIRNEDFDGFISITSPGQAVDKLSGLVAMSIWCDWEWVPYEEALGERFMKYEF